MSGSQRLDSTQERPKPLLSGHSHHDLKAPLWVDLRRLGPEKAVVRSGSTVSVSFLVRARTGGPGHEQSVPKGKSSR